MKQNRVTAALAVTFAMVWVGLLVGLPLVAIAVQSLSQGMDGLLKGLADPQTWVSLRFTLFVTLASLPPTVLFALAGSWVLARFRFPGRSVLLVIIDLPLSLSPVLVGVLVAFLHGTFGLLGPFWDSAGVAIIFNWPGVVLTTLFIVAPMVIREVLPVLEERGQEEEEAALTLGARPWFMYWRVTFPALRTALSYGMVLAFARAAGEFGAASVVSGLVRGAMTTLPIHIEILYNDFAATQAFAVSLLFVLLAVLTLAAKAWLGWRLARERQGLVQGGSDGA